MEINWDKIVENASNNPMMSMQNHLSWAEKAYEESGGISFYVGVVMDINGQYQIVRNGNRMSMIGATNMLLEFLKNEVMTEWLSPDA